MIFGKGYMTNDLFYTCSALVAQARFLKKDHKAHAAQLEDHYSQHFLDNNLKKDFLKAADLLYKRIKKLKYKNDKERASVLLDYQNSITVPAKKNYLVEQHLIKLILQIQIELKVALKILMNG